MSRQTNEERLVVLETKIDAIGKQIDGIDHKLEVMSGSFVTMGKHQDDLKDIKEAVERNARAIKETNSKRWFQNTLAAVFGAVLSLLIAYYFTHLGS